MKLRQFEALRAVVQTGTTKEAGELIHLTQSAVSKLIGQLEDDLSVKILSRSGGKMLLTPEGRMIYEDVERVLNVLDEMRAKADDTGALKFGKLRIGTMPALAHGLLPAGLARLRIKYPSLTTVIEELSRSRIEEQVASGYLDIGLVTMPVQSDRLHVVPLGTVSAVCVVPNSHRLIDQEVIHVTDLEGESVISVDPETLLRHRTDAVFSDARIRRKLLIQTQSTLLACQLVRQGLGVAIVHPLIALSLDPLVSFKRFDPEIELRYAAVLRNEVATGPAMEFVRSLSSEMQITVSSQTPVA